MEELSRTSRLSRRLALAAIICCCATSGYADRPASAPASGTSTFRSLLSQGWSNTAVASPKTSSVAAPVSSAATTAPAPGSSSTAAATPIIEVTPTPGPETVPARPGPIAELIRPKLKVLHVPNSKPSASDLGDSKATGPVAPPTAPQSLAELLTQRTKKIVVPKLEGESDTINVDLAPSVNRLDVDRPIVERIAQSDESESNVRMAAPIQTDPKPSDVVVSSEVAEESDAAQQGTVQPETPQHREPQLATKPPADPATSVADVDRQPEFDQPVRLESELSAAATPAETDQTASKLATAETKESVAELNPGTAQPITELADAGAESGDETASTPISDRSRRIASDGGFSLLPLKSFEPESATRLEAEDEDQSLMTTIHATRLREIARESLRNAHHRLLRGATHSAKKYTLEALRSIVAMQDASAGGNRHAKYLETAFDAVRESKDFSGRFGTVDQSALKRMVAVHETGVLKDQDLENMSALEATEAYLAEAKLNLVQAVAGVREGSDALVLLGKIERHVAPRDDTHAAAVAVTLQRAAVEIEPANALGYRELGSTLLQQGLVEQAVWALNRSIELNPTRTGYERLLEASRRLGDVDTARVCLTSLEDPQLPGELPVQLLSPKKFAATHRPSRASFQTASMKSKTTETPKQEVGEPRSRFRSLFPFGRR